MQTVEVRAKSFLLRLVLWMLLETVKKILGTMYILNALESLSLYILK